MMRKLFSTGGIISTLVLTAILVLLAMPRHNVLALVAVIAVEIYSWWRRPGEPWERAFASYALWVSSLTAVILVAISPQAITQIAIITAFVVWRIFLQLTHHRRAPFIALVMQFVALTALFTAAQVWRWPAALVMALAWGSAWMVAHSYLRSSEDPQAKLLAHVWALVVAEIAWVLSWWMIAYISPGAYLVIPQAALLISGVGYALGGIYTLHRSSKLSRNRLFEYLIVAGLLLAIILIGTRWNGTT